MLRQTIEVETGYTQRSLSTSEILLIPFSKNAQKSVTRRFSSPNKRKHIRNKEVWMCYSCASVETAAEKAEREATEQIVKALADETKRKEDAQRKADDDAVNIAALHRVVKEYPSYWKYALLQLPLFCIALYIPLTAIGMKECTRTCFYRSLFYYAIIILSFQIIPYNEGFRWEIICFGFMYAFIDYLMYSHIAKKGRKIPPPLPKAKI